MNDSNPSTTEQSVAQNSSVASKTDQGKIMSIVGLVLAFFVPLAGLIVSIIGYTKQKASGAKPTLGLVGIIVNAVFILLGILMFVLFVFVALPSLQRQQQDYGQTLQPSYDNYTSDNYQDDSENNALNQNLNQLGTVADATLQRDILTNISAFEGTSSYSITRIVSMGSLPKISERWTTSTGSSYDVTIIPTADGGSDFSVKRSN